MNPLSNVPGLGGYIAGQEQIQQQQMGDLQKAQAAFSLRGAMQDRQRQEAYRNELSALGPEPTQEQLAQVSAKYGSPADVLKTQQASIDKKDAANARAEAQRVTLEQKANDAQHRLQQQNQYAEMMHEYRMAQARTADDRVAETARHNKQLEQFQTQNAATMAELRRMGLQTAADKAAATADQQKGKQVQQLGTALERANLPEADATLRAVEDHLKKTPQIAEYLSGPKSMLPDMMVPQEVKEGRQAFQKLFNITLKNRSGSAVTSQELDRLKQEFATGAFKSPQQLQAAVNQARNIISQHYRSVAAGFGPDALNGYNDNLRQTGGTPLLEPQAAAAPQPTPSTQPGTAPPPPPGFTVNTKPRGR